jgi:hypothetical protein
MRLPATGCDTWPTLVMKGSAVRIRASPFDLQDLPAALLLSRRWFAAEEST